MTRHWTDDHIKWSYEDKCFIAYDEAGLEHSRHQTKDDARDTLVVYAATILGSFPKHLLYKTGDSDAPEAIKDRNGEVVLDMCCICGAGEIELQQPCEIVE